MRHVFLMLLALAVACRTPPPRFEPVPKPPEMPLAPLPEPVSPVAAPQPATPTAVLPEPPVVEPLFVALAAHDSPTVASLLAPEVTVTLANGDTCAGAQACADAIAGALADTKLQRLRQLHVGPGVEIVQGLAEVAQRRVPFAAVFELRAGRIAAVRVYGTTAPWRFVLDAPKIPLAPATSEPIDVVTAVPTFDVARLAAAFDPALLARDATAAGLVAENLAYRDTTAGAETLTAVANQAAIRAFQQAFAVQDNQLIGQYAAGDWLVLERDVTVRQRTPVVPVPLNEEVLRVRSLEFLLVQQGKIAEVWGYSDPVALLPAVEQLPIPPLH